MRSFAGVAVEPYQSPFVGQKLTLAIPNTFPPSVVKCIIDWNVPWQQAGNPANVGVLFNLITGQGQGTKGPPLDHIKSVYIDNTNSSVPVYVKFPSTGMTITAAPNTADWYPALTEDFTVQVFALGLTAGFIPTTGIWFTNVLMQPYSDSEINETIQQWLASATITRGTTIYNTNFGIPALGDQTYNGVFALGGTGTFLSGLMGTPYPSGFLYLTTLDILCTAAAGGGVNRIQLESTGAAGILFQFVTIIGSQQLHALGPLCGMNIKLDATQTYRMNCTAFSGASTTVAVNLNFTTNPN